jgi:hypothetical protein
MLNGLKAKTRRMPSRKGHKDSPALRAPPLLKGVFTRWQRC